MCEQWCVPPVAVAIQVPQTDDPRSSCAIVSSHSPISLDHQVTSLQSHLRVECFRPCLALVHGEVSKSVCDFVVISASPLDRILPNTGRRPSMVEERRNSFKYFLSEQRVHTLFLVGFGSPLRTRKSLLDVPNR